MAKYIGPKCRLCRTEGKQLFLKGDRCFDKNKCAIFRRNSAPGMHGAKRKKLSGYGEQLREKQRIRKIYGVLEKQFRIYIDHAMKAKGISGTNLLRILESRFDSVVVKANFAPSRAAARQLIGHGHFLLNGKKVNIPSVIVKPNDVIEVNEKSRQVLPIKASVENAGKRGAAEWLDVNAEKFKVQVKRLPDRSDIDPQLNEQLVIEFYSR